jgi:predicted enzyme related to lactoylglutathione lyase
MRPCLVPAIRCSVPLSFHRDKSVQTAIKIESETLEDKVMANPFVHVELQTKDLAKAKDFYSRLFDWKLEDIPAPGGEMTYTMINVGEGTGGGMFENQDPKVPSHWLAYVGVDDIAASTAKARDLGATVLQDVMQVGDYGWLSVIMDPTGAVIAMWKPNMGK